MNLPFNPLQKAIIERVTADMPTTPIYCPFAPAGAVVPYAALTAMSASDSSPKGMTMWGVTCTLDIYSDAERSFEELNTLMDALNVSLMRRDLTLESEWQQVQARVVAVSVTTEFTESGAVQHGTLQIRFDLVHVP
jgi:hypothetical protein